MSSSARRLILLVVVGAVWSAAGSALLASPAGAVIDPTLGTLKAAVYNPTPYPWTLVAAQAPTAGPNPPTTNCIGVTCWQQQPAATIAPGGGTLYVLVPNYRFVIYHFGILTGSEFGYNAWFTYRVDVVGLPEYVTVAISQCECHNGSTQSSVLYQVWDTTAPPPADYNPGASFAYPPPPPAVPATSSPQLAWAYQVPYSNDLTFTLAGDHTIDASSSLGQGMADLLEAFCNQAASSKCSFTQTQPLSWRLGTPVKTGQAMNCTDNAGATQRLLSTGPTSGELPPEPPSLDPDWHEVEYEATQSATLTVGGSFEASAESSLFGIISTEISVKIEAEHEWQEIRSFTRSTKVFIPSNYFAGIWVAPEVGVVTGTLDVSAGSAHFALTNFSEQRSGVSKSDLSPAFDVIVKTRPLTPAEFQANCKLPPSAKRADGAKGSASPAPRLAAARVRRGQTAAQVLRELGQPLVQRFTSRACRIRDLRCNAIGGRGGTWAYPGVSVAFAPDGRVRALIYGSGGRRSMVPA